MKHAALLFLLVAASCLSAEIREIPAALAVNYVGKTVCVTGAVAQISVRNNNAYLNFGAKYPSNTFTVFIPGSMLKKLPSNFRAWENHEMKVTGTIALFKNRPQIVVTNSAAIKIDSGPGEN